MSVLLLWIALSGVPDQTAAKALPAQTEGAGILATEPRQLFEIHKELRQLLRDEAVIKDRKSWESAVVKLVELYGEITRDERLPSSDALNGYRVKLRSRLLKVQKQLERELGSEQNEETGTGPSRAATAGASKSGGSPPTGPPGSLQDGDGAAARHGAAGGAAVDGGLALVELIQRTISPEFWDVNGGPGTIVYYRQWHALVVRATPQIHRRIGGVVGGVRK